MDYELIKLKERISDILLEMGASPDLVGFGYIKDCVIIALEKKGKINSVVKDLYTVIAKRHGSSAHSVEKTIRHIIKTIWSKGRIDKVNACLGVKIFSRLERPSGSKFIMVIAEKVSSEFYISDKGKLTDIGIGDTSD